MAPPWGPRPRPVWLHGTMWQDLDAHGAVTPLLSAAGAYELICDDPVARRALAAWLDGMRLPWPGEITLTVVVGRQCPFPDDGREVFRQPDVLIQGGGRDGVLRLTWQSAPAVAIIDHQQPSATVWFSPAAIEQLPNGERSFLLLLLIFLLRRVGWFHIHGAALRDRQGRGWLLAGNSHTGKSTTTALMAQHGWQVSTDDMSFVEWQPFGCVVHGVHSRVALREGGRALLGATGGLPLPERRKDGFWAEELGSVWIPTVRPGIVAFPEIGARTSMVPARARQTLGALVKWSLCVLYEPAFAEQHLDVLSSLAAQARCFDLTLGPDLFSHPHLLEELTA